MRQLDHFLYSRKVLLLIVSLSAVIAHLFFFETWRDSLYYDANAYYTAAEQIRDHGMFYKYLGSGWRTYGYPTILSYVIRPANMGTSARLLIFEFQLTLYLSAVLVLWRFLCLYSRRIALLVLVGMSFNLYLLIYAREVLTESTSISIVVILASCFMLALRLTTFSSQLRVLVAGSMLAGFSVMIRPAMIFVVPVWIAVGVFIATRRQVSALRLLAIATVTLVGVVIPTIPQVINNVRLYGRWTPLVAVDLQKGQHLLGIRLLKYLTYIGPHGPPSVGYNNAFIGATIIDQRDPLHWYIDHPGRGAATTLVHMFNLVDQDYPFPYVKRLAPGKFHAFATVLNHLIVGFGVFGLYGWARAPRQTNRDTTLNRLGFWLVLLYLAGYFAVYALTSVEARFGLPLLLLLFPLASVGANACVSAPRRTSILVISVIAVYAAVALPASEWVQNQAPQIKAARLAAGIAQFTFR